MSRLTKILLQEVPNGVYRFGSRAQADRIAEKVEDFNWQCFLLDGGAMDSKATFLATCAKAFDLPDYFGANWDAWEETLNDLSWAPARGYIVLFDNVTAFADRATDAWETAVDIFGMAADNWGENGKPFYVLLRRAGGYWTVDVEDVESEDDDDGD